MKTYCENAMSEILLS